MKIKTILGMIACAGACASYSAFANTTTNWFGVSTTESYGCATTGVFTVEGSKFVIDNELSDALTLTPSVANPGLSDGYVVIDAEAELTPSTLEDLYESTNELITAGVKVGFAVATIEANNVVTSNFYGYANRVWTKLTGEPDDEKVNGQTAFTLKLDYRTNKVKFYVNGTLLTAATGGAEEFVFGSGSLTLGDVAAFGSGSVATIDADYEIGVVAIGDVKYGSVADALAANGTASTIKDVGADGTIATETPTVADNGMSVAVCKALGLSTTDSNAKVTVVPAANDTDAGNVTLALSDADTANLEPGLVVKFAVKLNNEPVTGSPFAQNAIKVPCATGIYTVEPVSVEVAAP